MRFELMNGRPLPVFKTGAFNPSATLPREEGILQKAHKLKKQAPFDLDSNQRNFHALFQL